MGVPISELDPVALPLKEGDFLEISRPREGEPDRFDSFRCPASAASVVQATTELKGVLELATNEEAIAGVDFERGVTPTALEAALLNLLQNRIIAGDGIDLDFSGGSLTIAVV